MTSLEPWPSATSNRRPRAHRASASERSTSPRAFAASAPPRWRPIGRVLDPEPLAQPERLREVPRGDLDLVAVAPQLLDHGPQHEHVRRVREVDPDFQTRAASGAGERGHDLADLLAGQHRADRQREVRARQLVGGRQLRRRAAYGAIAGWRWSGVR